MSLATSKSQLAYLKKSAEEDLILGGDQYNMKWFDTHQPLPLDQLGTGLEVHCPSEKCKRRLASTPKPSIKNINGRFQISGVCEKCGKGVSSFISKDKMKKQEGGSIPNFKDPQYTFWYKYPGMDINNADYSRLWKYPPLPGEGMQAYQDRIEYLYSNTVPYDLIQNFYGMNLMDALMKLNQKGRPGTKAEKLMRMGKEIGKAIHDDILVKLPGYF